MAEKEDDIETQHDWRSNVGVWRSGDLAIWDAKSMSKRRRMRQREADKVFIEFREWYDGWFQINMEHKVILKLYFLNKKCIYLNALRSYSPPGLGFLEKILVSSTR